MHSQGHKVTRDCLFTHSLIDRSHPCGSGSGFVYTTRVSHYAQASMFACPSEQGECIVICMHNAGRFSLVWRKKRNPNL